MPKKSLIQRATADFTLRAHNCQANPKHRLVKGEVRMRVAVARSFDHYCQACALAIIEQDLAKLQQLKASLQRSQANRANPSTENTNV